MNTWIVLEGESNLAFLKAHLPDKIQTVAEFVVVGGRSNVSSIARTVLVKKTCTPDFTVSKADLAIELKLSAAASHEKEFIAQINDDILAYGTQYRNMIFVVYDCGYIRDTDLFISSFESHGSLYVRVVKH